MASVSYEGALDMVGVSSTCKEKFFPTNQGTSKVATLVLKTYQITRYTIGNY